MRKKGINYLNLIYELKEIGKNDEEKINSILYRYKINNIKVLQRRILNFIFSIDECKIKLKLIEAILEAGNLPITNTLVNDKKYDINQSSNNIDCNTLFSDLKQVGRGNEEGINKLLNIYNIPNIKVLQYITFEYIFSVEDLEIKSKLFNTILKINNLPIIIEQFHVMDLEFYENKSIVNEIKNQVSKLNEVEKSSSVGRTSLLSVTGKNESKPLVENNNHVRVFSHKYINIKKKKFIY